MKKIPTLFTREFQNHIVTGISPALSDPSLQWVLDGEGVATEKIDGACCAIINGTFYKRYDAKKDKRGNLKTPPEGSIPCDDPDPVTGHWPERRRSTVQDQAARFRLQMAARGMIGQGRSKRKKGKKIAPRRKTPGHEGEDRDDV